MITAGTPPGTLRTAVPFLLMGALLLACGPWLFTWSQLLWSRPHYQFFPLVLVGAAVLGWSSWRGLGALHPGGKRSSLMLVALAWVALLVAEVAYSPTLAAGGVLVALAAIVYGLGGRQLFGSVLPAWGFLWLAVPLPFGLDHRLVTGLQGVTTRWSSGVLDLLGIDHLMSGNVVEIAGRRLFVEEACSGVQSLFAVICCTLFYLLWKRRPLLHGFALLAAAAGWVVAANVARVSGLAYVNEVRGLYLFDGLGHQLIGLAIFLFTLMLIWSTDRLLLFLWQPAALSQAQPSSQAEPTRLPPLATTWLGSWLILLAFVMLVVLQMGFVDLDAPSVREHAPELEARLLALKPELLPERWHDWIRRDFQTETRTASSEFGRYSRTWNYQVGAMQSALSVDFLFPEWHDLTICYSSQGWQVEEQSRIEFEGLPIIVERLVKPGARHGYLLFAEFDGRGQPLRPPRGGFLYRCDRRLSLFGQRWFGLDAGGMAAVEPAAAGPVWQVQLVVESYAPLTPQAQEQARAFLVDAVTQVRQVAAAAE